MLESAGLSAFRLAEVRSTGSAILLFAAVAIFRPAALRVTKRELAFFAVFGVAGLACVQLFYFLAIERLEIGVALVIQYLAPVFVALWARFVAKEPVRGRLWIGIALSLSRALPGRPALAGAHARRGRGRRLPRRGPSPTRATSSWPNGACATGATRSPCSPGAFSSRRSRGP